MSRWSLWLTASALCTLAASPALALGPSLGVRLGYGQVLFQDVPQAPEAGVFAVGPAARFDLGLLTFEADLLYSKTTIESGVGSNVKRVATPVLAKVNIMLAPGLAYFSFGAGIEPRWLLGAERDGVDTSAAYADKTLHVPVVAGLDLDLKAALLNVELRYSHQIESEFAQGNGRAHQFMGMVGVFF